MYGVSVVLKTGVKGKLVSGTCSVTVASEVPFGVMVCMLHTDLSQDGI